LKLWLREPVATPSAKHGLPRFSQEQFGSHTVRNHHGQLPLRRKNINVNVDGKKVDSGLNKLGVIMGDHCNPGINSALALGVKVGPYGVVGSGVCLQEDLEPGRAAFLDKKDVVVKENTITLSTSEKAKLNELLKKYGKTT
jgi:acetyltransferase-like isoleucine patch superfamily enzyme